MIGKSSLYRLPLCCLALSLLFQMGCLSFVHPVDPLPAEEIQPVSSLPAACKNEVYVFFLHGMDPLDLGNLSGLHNYVQSLGFIKTYYGQPFHAFYYEKEIRRLRKRDPNARIVLIGFSYGAGLIRDVACSLRRHQIDIDLIVYIDGVELDGRRLHRPANVHKVLNILSFNRSDKRMVEEGDNIKHNDAWHFGTVTHPDTVRAIVTELTAVAQRVPVVTVMPPALPDFPIPATQQLPPPTAVDKPSDKTNEWNFLKADAHGNGIAGRRPSEEAMRMDPATLKSK